MKTTTILALILIVFAAITAGCSPQEASAAPLPVETQTAQVATPTIEITVEPTVEITPEPTAEPTLAPTATPVVTFDGVELPASDAERNAYLGSLNSYCVGRRQYQNYNVLETMTFIPDASVGFMANFDVTVRPTCNYNPDRNGLDIEAIVLHHTESPAEHAIYTWREVNENGFGTSAHYLVLEDGSIIQLVPEDYTAFHVSWTPVCDTLGVCHTESGYRVNPANTTIGIEIVNTGGAAQRKDGSWASHGFTQPEERIMVWEGPTHFYKYEGYTTYTEAQLIALQALIEDISARHNLTVDQVIRHSDVQAKTDPGPALDDFMVEYSYETVAELPGH